MRYKGHVTFKYPVWVCTLALIGAGCTAPDPLASASPTRAAAGPSSAPARPPAPTPTPTSLATAVPAKLTTDRTWYTVPDGLVGDPAFVTVAFAADPSAGRPRVRIDPIGREIALAPAGSPLRWTATVDLAGIAPGVYKLGVVERVARGADERLGPADAYAPDSGNDLRVSAPEYVVWTLDFEGDEASDAAMANTAAAADALKVPVTVMWNPRAWTPDAVPTSRAEAMLAWTKGRAANGDEVALHLHMWTDYVRAAGVAPRTQPNWAGRLDGYDVPMTAYTESEQRTLIAYGLRLMSEQGLTGVTSFRAGGDFGDAATLRALVANGITADCTAVPAGTFGSLRWPWTLPADAQPYAPSRDDANRQGDLPILEAPTNGGNTYAYNAASIAPIVRTDLAMLAKPGEVATARKGLTIVSHPGTIDAAERGAIEALIHAFDPLRYDQDKGPLRFVTLRQLAQAWSRRS